MFNLPWFSWFNVLAMPCLWAMLSLNSALASQPVWHRKVMKVQILAAIVTIFLYWNPAVSALITPLHVVLVLLVLPLLLWNVGAVALEMCRISWINVAAIARKPLPAKFEPTGLSPAIAPDAISDNDVDLDGGESPLQHEREIGEVISTLFSSRASTSSMVDGLGKLFGEPDDQELLDSGGVYVVGMFIYAVAVSVVLMPAAYMSLSMLGMYR